MKLFINPSESDMREAGEIISSGGLVAFPTETVYGLGADAFNPEACARIFEVKRRPHFDPLICHVADKSGVDKLAYITNQQLFDKLTDAFWPGPLTLILPKREAVPDIVTGGLDTVAVRMPDGRIALDLIRYSSGAIAAPSANPFGFLSPTKASHVIDALGDSIDAVIDGGDARFGVESTVIDLSGDEVMVLRYGALALEDIESVLGVKIGYVSNIYKLKSPGQVKKHYSPTKKLVLFNDVSELNGVDFASSGVLYYSKGDDSGLPFAVKEFLCEEGDLVEAAASLFSALHRLEDSECSTIYAQCVAERGLGRAIQDRLVRASYR